MKNLLILSALAALAFGTSAKADDTLLTLSGDPGPTSGGSAGNYLIGIAFTPTTDLTLTQFGALAGNDPGAGNNTSFVSDGKTTQDFTDVLYTFKQTGSTSGIGTVVTSAVIPTGTSVNGDGVAFAATTPILLTAGTEYFIGSDGDSGTASELGNDDYLQGGNGANNFSENVGIVDTPTDITLDTSGVSTDAANYGSGIGAPSSLVPGASQEFTLANVYFAGNFRYVVGDVPEPSDLAYGAVGLAALAFLLRRRRGSL